MLLGLAGLVWWRDHATAALVAAAAGAGLVLGGLAVPGGLGPVHRAWMGLAHVLSRVTTPVVLGILYFLVLAPVALVRRALGQNALRHPEVGGSYWISRDAAGLGRRSDLTRQF